MFIMLKMQSAMSFINEHLLLAQNITDYDGCEKADTWTTESTDSNGLCKPARLGKKKRIYFLHVISICGSQRGCKKI